MELVEIDGSVGEGGGQILRTAISLSCVTGVPVRVYNIRANRPSPGLKNQHLWGVKLAAQLCGAKVEGLKLGSREILFKPSRIKGGNYKIDIGTAGSITLLLQTVLLPAIFADSPVTFDITGGTDVAWSPPVDYYRYVFFPILKKMGVDVKMRVIERGYYPRGMGRVIVEASPIEKLSPLHIVSRGRELYKHAYINLRGLPYHIVSRMKNTLENFEIHEDVKIENPRKGCGIVLVAVFEKTVLGADSLCRRGVPAEKVASSALEKLKLEIASKSTVDANMADHLIPWLYMAKGGSYSVREITKHTRTNAWVVSRFGGDVKIEDSKIKVYA